MLLAALPFASAMQSSFMGDPTAWLYLSAIIVLNRLSPRSAPSTFQVNPTSEQARKRA